MCACWLGVSVINYELEERRIENAFLARDNCEEDSWGWNYWNNVIGALTRKLNRELTIPYK